MRKLLISAGAVALASLACAANATVTTYTDLAAFSAAAGPTTLETFDEIVGEPDFRTTPLTVGDLTFSGHGAGQGVRNKIDQPPADFAPTNVDGTAFASMVVVGSNTGVQVNLNLAKPPVFAFGADFGGLQDNQIRTHILVAVNGAQPVWDLTPPQQTGSVVSFFGFVSDDPILALVFLGVNDTAFDGFGMDNVRLSAPPSGAPEPASWALMVAGFGVGGLALRRRHPVVRLMNSRAR